MNRLRDATLQISVWQGQALNRDFAALARLPTPMFDRPADLRQAMRGTRRARHRGVLSLPLLEKMAGA